MASALRVNVTGTERTRGLSEAEERGEARGEAARLTELPHLELTLAKTDIKTNQG